MTSFRDIAREELMRLEYRYRSEARGLAYAAEHDHVALLTDGAIVHAKATFEERQKAFASELARIQEAQVRATALRRVGRILRRVLGALGAEPCYDRENPPETVRQARAAMHVDDVEDGPEDARPAIELDRGRIEAAAKQYGILTESDDGIQR